MVCDQISPEPNCSICIHGSYPVQKEAERCPFVTEAMISISSKSEPDLLCQMFLSFLCHCAHAATTQYGFLHTSKGSTALKFGPRLALVFMLSPCCDDSSGHVSVITVRAPPLQLLPVPPRCSVDSKLHISHKNEILL